MPELTTVGGAWALVAAVLVGLLALYAASLDSVLSARANGSGGFAVAAPLFEAARLMRQRRRTLVAADRLLLPGRVSIARRLIEHWYGGPLGR